MTDDTRKRDELAKDSCPTHRQIKLAEEWASNPTFNVSDEFLNAGLKANRMAGYITGWSACEAEMKAEQWRSLAEEMKKKLDFAEKFILNNSGTTLDEWIRSAKEQEEADRRIEDLLADFQRLKDGK